MFRQEAPPDLLSSSPVSDVNTKILADLALEHTNLTSEGNGTNDHNSMEDRQLGVNRNGMERHDSLGSGNGDSLSPGSFTSFHGLNIIADSMGHDGEGKRQTTAASGWLVSTVPIDY